jgi:hypothetical protein
MPELISAHPLARLSELPMAVKFFMLAGSQAMGEPLLWSMVAAG